MPRKSRPTILKREKERARQQKRKEKEARRAEAKRRKSGTAPTVQAEDSEVAGIHAGAQSLLEQRERNNDIALESIKEVHNDNL